VSFGLSLPFRFISDADAGSVRPCLECIWALEIMDIHLSANCIPASRMTFDIALRYVTTRLIRPGKSGNRFYG